MTENEKKLFIGLCIQFLERSLDGVHDITAAIVTVSEVYDVIPSPAEHLEIAARIKVITG